MGTQPKKKDHQNKDRRGRRKGGTRHQFKPRRPEYITPDCAICENKISDITSALARPEDTAPVHFDCALNVMRKSLNPEEGQIVIYLGRGSFAVVDESEYRKKRLKIIRREDWEIPESPPAWRKELSTTAE